MANLIFDSGYTEEAYLSQIQRNFTTRAPVYNSGISGAMHQDLVNTLLFFHPPKYPVLDIACGTGLLAQTLGSEGQGVTGVDLTPAMLEQARKIAPLATFLTGRAERLPLPDRQFGCVYICAALVYFTDVPGVMGEAWRVLKEGGFIAYQAVTLDSYVMGIGLQNALVEVLGREEGLKVFCLPHAITDTKEANEKLLVEAGFDDVRIERVTVLSEMTVEEVQRGWEGMVGRNDRNALTMRIGMLPQETLQKVRAAYIGFMERRRNAGNVILESVSSWYVRGTKPRQVK